MNMKKFIYLVVLICSFGLAGCTSETESLFEGTSADRIEKELEEAKEVLVSAPNGWLMEYYPSSQLLYGGYNVLASFTEDGNVTISADIVDASQKATSFYKLKEQAGPVLTFDTYNEIFHFFAEPNSGIGATGTGMGGDYEFTVMSASNEEVVLKGKKTGNYIRMTPLQESVTWEAYLTSIAEAEALVKYSQFKYKVNGEEFVGTKSYRTLSFSYVKDGEKVTEIFSYIQTPTGLKFYTPITLGGGSVSELSYDATANVWKAEGAELVPYITPASVFQGEGPWYLTYDNMGDFGKVYADKAMEMAATAYPNKTLEYLTIAPGSGAVSMVVGGEQGLLELNTTTVDENTISLTLTGMGDSKGVEFANAGLLYAVIPFAYFDPVTFKVEPDDIENPTKITMTEVGNERNVIVVTNQETPFGYHK